MSTPKIWIRETKRGKTPFIVMRGRERYTSSWSRERAEEIASDLRATQRRREFQVIHCAEFVLPNFDKTPSLEVIEGGAA